MRDKKKWLIVGLIALGVVALHLFSRGQFNAAVPPKFIDLGKPDAFLQSQKISAIPSDLVKMPGLGQVLTQEFVTYYEDHPTRLSLEGTLRRLAYEHQLTWQEQLVAQLLDTTGDIAFWRDGKGKLSDFALVLQKNMASTIAEQLAKVALQDKQLSRAGTLQVDGNDVTVYALTLRKDLIWLLASHKDKLLLLSHPSMLLTQSNQIASQAQKTAQALLSKSAKSPWLEEFHGELVNPPPFRHSMMFKASFLSFGYQHFFPGLQAIELQMQDGATWQVRAAANASTWAGWPETATHAWSVMPHGAALCTALPVDWRQGEPALRSLLGEGAKALSDDLLPGAGLCWYASSGLYAPMISARLKPGANARHDASLMKLLTQATNARVNEAKANPAQTVEKKLNAGKSVVWTKDVSATNGYLINDPSKATHRVALARFGESLMASVDHRLINQSAAVSAKTYPALSDTHPFSPVLIAQWSQVAKLLETESTRLATREAAPLFHTVSREQLKPRLDALASAGNLTFSAPKAQSAALAQQATETSSKVWLWKPLTLTLTDSARK